MPAVEVIDLRDGDEVALARRQGRLVRVGRPSPWGNPYSHVPDAKNARFTVATRDEAVAKYVEWLASQPRLVERAKRELRGKVLGCWCAPSEACHARVLAKLVNDAYPGDAKIKAPPLPPTAEALREKARNESPGSLIGPIPAAVVATTQLGLYDPKSYGARCDECPLKGRHTPVPPTYAAGGPSATKMIIVGEGPGRMEIQEGRPFCFVPETRVLMANLSWRLLGDVRVGDHVFALGENPEESGTGVSGHSARRWQIATVTATHRRVAACIEVRTLYGTLIGTPDHKVLTSYPKAKGGAKRWMALSRLACGAERAAHIMSIGAVWDSPQTYDVGWLAGFLDGEGHVLGSKSVRVRRAGRVGFAQNVGPVLERARTAIESLGFKTLAADKIRSKPYPNSTCRRIDIAGGFIESIRFLGVVRPVRLLADFRRIVDRVSSRSLLRSRVLEKIKLDGEREVVDITTTAGTFIAEGMIVHNCGPSGQMVNKLLLDAGMSRSLCHVTNSAACRGDTDWEKDRAAACCSARLSNELAALPADVPILALGAPAAKVMLGRGSILKTRGFVWKLPTIDPAKIRSAERSLEKRRARDRKKFAAAIDRAEQTLWRSQARAPLAGRTCIPSIHPAFVLRGGEQMMPMLRVDVRRAVRAALDGPLALIDDGPYVMARTVAEFVAHLQTIRTKEILVDVETLGPEPLVDKMTMFGVAEVPDGEKVKDDDMQSNHVRVVLASPPHEKAGDRRRLQKTLKGMGAALYVFIKERGITVVGHNLASFDMLVTPRYGLNDDIPIHDSLVAHHTYASHMRQGLDHVVSMYCDASPWKISFKAKGAEEKGGVQSRYMSSDDLDRYNAADCRGNAVAWRRMQPDLEDEMVVYRADMVSAGICRSMSRRGFAFDQKLADELSAKLKSRAGALLGQMRMLLGKPNFHPARPNDLRAALFGQLRVRPLAITATGLASTASLTLEQVKSPETRAGRLADLILRWRATQKTRSTFIDRIKPHEDGRVHPSWKSFGTVTGRYSCRGPNLMNLPRWSRALENRVRELYVAAPGHVLIYYDLSQSEMRMAAYLSGDENFIASCESGDVHTSNAKILFPDARDVLEKDPKGKHCPRHGDEGDAKSECTCGKPFRDVAKNAGFGILYQADSETIFKFLRSQGFDVSLPDVEAMFAQIHKVYARYYEFCDENWRYCKQHGHLREFFSKRIRWFGWYPSITDTSNYPVQGGIAALMNMRLAQLVPRLPRGAGLVAQVHDAAITEARGSFELVGEKKKQQQARGRVAVETVQLIRSVWDEPIVTPTTGQSWRMPIDLKMGYRWSDFG